MKSNRVKPILNHHQPTDRQSQPSIKIHTTLLLFNYSTFRLTFPVQRFVYIKSIPGHSCGTDWTFPPSWWSEGWRTPGAGAFATRQTAAVGRLCRLSVSAVSSPPSPLPICVIGWSDFWKQNWTHVMLCQIVIGPQFQSFTLKCCFLTSCRASENVDCMYTL